MRIAVADAIASLSNDAIVTSSNTAGFSSSRCEPAFQVAQSGVVSVMADYVRATPVRSRFSRPAPLPLLPMSQRPGRVPPQRMARPGLSEPTASTRSITALDTDGAYAILAYGQVHPAVGACGSLLPANSTQLYLGSEMGRLSGPAPQGRRQRLHLLPSRQTHAPLHKHDRAPISASLQVRDYRRRVCGPQRQWLP